MSCGCGKKTKFTESSPLILGDANGAPAQRVRATVTLNGVRPGAELWVSGSGVASMLASRFIRPF